MLRVKAIAPLYLAPEEVVRRQLRYGRLGAGHAQVTLFNLDEDAPCQLNTPEDIAESEKAVWEEIARTDARQFDVILPDCVLDPGVGEVGESPVPLVGILRLAAGHLASLGESFAAVTRNQAIGDELRRKIVGYGLGAYLTSVELLDVDFCFVSDHSGWAAAMEPVCETIARNGVTRLLNGCSAVEIPDRNLGGVVVVDPTELAIQLLGTAQNAGLFRNPRKV